MSRLLHHGGQPVVLWLLQGFDRDNGGSTVTSGLRRQPTWSCRYRPRQRYALAPSSSRDAKVIGLASHRARGPLNFLTNRKRAPYAAVV